MPESTRDQPKLGLSHSYATDLEGFYTAVSPGPVSAPKLLFLNRKLAAELGLDVEALDGKHGAAIFSGAGLPEDARPIAQVYAGSQFGHFNPQLGDGRALLLGEVVDRDGVRRDIQLKGSGRTPYSRGGDGLAALGPVLREYLVAEAMHALGVPTTRALAVCSTGEMVLRDRALPGAVLTRVASSHVRVGTFQFFAARGENERVKKLADYAIARHFPHLVDSDERYLELLRAACERQASLIAKWMLVGFVHGVMNTDNTAIAGETIDYGPCAFMDRYDPATVFSSIDRNGRYAYANQPAIAGWNLARLAETLLPWIDSDLDRAIEHATEVVQSFEEMHEAAWTAGMRSKLGLATTANGDAAFAHDLLALLHKNRVDYTQAFRALGQGEEAFLAQFEDRIGATEWHSLWVERLRSEGNTPERRAASMLQHNPVYIPRNHLVEAALESAVTDQDLEPFRALRAVLARPFEEQPGAEKYAEPAPLDSEPYRTFCGT